MNQKLTFSVDWEDFGQLYNWFHYHEITPPKNQAIDRQTNAILDLLDRAEIKGTFFVLGMLAKYRPDLVRRIQSRGHEIALHGFNHIAMFKLDHDQAQNDISDSYKLVTDIISAPVYGFRAPFFSILKNNLTHLEFLAEIGLLYDSSIFPMKLPRYGIADFPSHDHLMTLESGKSIVELPLSVLNCGPFKLPFSGGGYLRLLPKWILNKFFEAFQQSGRSAMIYSHPYEFDPLPLDVSSNYADHVKAQSLKINLLNFKWNLFRKGFANKIISTINKYQFNTCLERANYVKANGISAIVLGR